MRYHKYGILVVEDDEQVLSLIEIQLRMEGFYVLRAMSGAQALSLWESSEHHIDLIVTDIILPGSLNGFQLVDEIRKTQPKMPALYMTGYTDHELVISKIIHGLNFFYKPFDVSELLKPIKILLDLEEPCISQRENAKRYL